MDSRPDSAVGPAEQQVLPDAMHPEHGPFDGPECGAGRRDDIILDFLANDVDAEYERIAALGVGWVMPPPPSPGGTGP